MKSELVQTLFFIACLILAWTAIVIALKDG